MYLTYLIFVSKIQKLGVKLLVATDLDITNYKILCDLKIIKLNQNQSLSLLKPDILALEVKGIKKPKKTKNSAKNKKELSSTDSSTSKIEQKPTIVNVHYNYKALIDFNYYSFKLNDTNPNIRIWI
jgi:hypothetical protein